MKKNDKFIGVCEGYNDKGFGVVKHQGIVFFVKGLIRAEKAEILVISMKKNYGFGKVQQIIEPSEHRVVPKCSVYQHCGGCQIQHLDDKEQGQFKTQKVSDCFKSIAQMDVKVNEIIGASQLWRYRNKVQVPVQVKEGRARIGFYRNRTNDLVEFEDCLVQTKLSNDILKFCKQKMEELQNAKEIRHILIKHAHQTNQVMVVLIAWKYPFSKSEELVNLLVAEFSEIESVVVNINDRKDNVILSNSEVVVAKENFIEETLNDFKFKISSKSFYQINPEQTLKLYNQAVEYAGLTGIETVVDLYCGTGTIGLFAAPNAKKVIGIEIVKEAIIDAQKSAKINGVENVEFICADAKDGAAQIVKCDEKVDVVIVDPPRKGCDEETLQAIVKMNPQKIVYVSCDPSTLARDIKKLVDNEYELVQVQPVDMFPMTYHVETCALLSRKNNNH